jgi:LPXTG-site transpeptidase (sortase) family protein
MANNSQQELYNNPFERGVLFFLVAMGVITITYVVLYATDFLPEAPAEVDTAASSVAVEKEVLVLEENETPEIIDPRPTTIIFDTLDKEVTVLNPESREIDDLDAALLSGVVRHPDSADFQNEGTVFLFGHSSYLPKVINKNFQAFNGIEKLKWGNTVRLQSSDMEYVYRVDRVYEVKASDAEVKIERGEAKLTLATCNSFGSKDDRYIVEATLVDSYSL